MLGQGHSLQQLALQNLVRSSKNITKYHEKLTCPLNFQDTNVMKPNEMHEANTAESRFHSSLNEKDILLTTNNQTLQDISNRSL